LRIVRSARALRLLRLGRLVAFLGEAGQETRRLLVRHQLHYALLVTIAVLVACAAVVFAVEDGSGGSIDSFGDSMWWAVTTITTVGYGDTFPVTPAGRGVAAFLMVAGIALFGVLTANLAAFLLERAPGKDTPKRSTDDRLDEILDRLRAVEEALNIDPRHERDMPEAASGVFTSPAARAQKGPEDQHEAVSRASE
jgi:voltage-gated potassium channel